VCLCSRRRSRALASARASGPGWNGNGGAPICTPASRAGVAPSARQLKGVSTTFQAFSLPDCCPELVRGRRQKAAICTSPLPQRVVSQGYQKYRSPRTDWPLKTRCTGTSSSASQCCSRVPKPRCLISQAASVAGKGSRTACHFCLSVLCPSLWTVPLRQKRHCADTFHLARQSVGQSLAEQEKGGGRGRDGFPEREQERHGRSSRSQPCSHRLFLCKPRLRTPDWHLALPLSTSTRVSWIGWRAGQRGT